jgi:hypothetical protein
VDVKRALADKLGRMDGDRGGAVSNKNVSDIFRRPLMLKEEKMYWSIMRKIVDQWGGSRERREEKGKKGGKGERSHAAIASSSSSLVPDGIDNKGDNYGMPLPYGPCNNDNGGNYNRYKLSAGKTVEAYKLLNLWREV